ncbi:uncharacterized protein LOC116338172 [Contarinia nasturtii]|uniref:uncharacterized protein LOC116338172 n=1 Tax=Contarinia nasturtii TaxID=265458 RepID=UPI0012D4B4E6|nr:uncharacterized protein LOC116338172 [Contarinia nasturtii]XP_031619136.1 uncharacterized protein LOC116338172 [Contarinia nasturtii]
MLIRKNTILLLLFALHASADVFKTNEIPDVPAEDLVPPPEDQESIVVRYQGDGQPSKSLFQRVITWFGFNGDPQSQSTNKKQNAKIQTQKTQQQKQNGYVYENPAKPFSPSPQKFSQSPVYTYDDPSKIILTNGFRYEPAGKLQPQSQQGYTYEPPPHKLELQPESGYTYDPPRPPVKLQQQPTPQQNIGYTYIPPPVKLQQPSSTGYTYSQPPVKLQEPPKPQPTGYTYPNPVKFQQKPGSLNDLVSSAASPTAVYSFNGYPFSQRQQQQQQQPQPSDSFPCNKIPWLPIFPDANELNLLRARLQAKNPNFLQSVPGYANIQPIARPTPEKFLNAHTYLPPRQRPLRHPSQVATPNQINSINTINSLPLPSTAQPFRAPPPTMSSTYLQYAQNNVQPIQTTPQSFYSSSVPNYSVTQAPPLYEPKPFTINDAQANGIYVNGRLVTPTGLSTTSVQSLQVINQNHPVTQSQKIVQPTNSYGTPASVYGPPVTYGPPTNTYGTPPIKLTAEVTESSVYSQFSASQPFTARPTLSSADKFRYNSNLEQNSNLIEKPIIISDSAADASESTRSPQGANAISEENQPILQVLHELNVSTASPQGFQYPPTSTEPSLSISAANQLRNKEKAKVNSNRETPLDLLDTPIQHYRKTSIGPSTTPDPNALPEFKFMRNTWKPLPPNPFSNPLNVVTTASPQRSSPVTPSAASAAFQSHTQAHDVNAIENQDNEGKKTKKIQIIIPYTNKARPSPFKNNQDLQSFESSAGWSNSQHNDDHNSEESQVISAATPSPKPGHHHPKRTNSQYLTKILAKNIRELLKREHLKNISTIDLAKLQKNIDGWTEQEFSMGGPNRASTISLLAQPKLIPYEYLTTTQSLQDLLTTESMQPTTEYPSTLYEVSDSTESDDDSQSEGEIVDDESEDENEIHGQDNGDNIAPDEQEAIQQAEDIEDEDFKRLDYLKSQHIFYATNPPPSTTPQPRVTTPMPPCSTTPASDAVRTTVLPSADELWNRLKSLLAPATDKNNEKVYIVTPQPYPYFESEKIVNDDDNEVVGHFKSPRFLVRPTPGAATGRAANSFARLTFKPRMGRLQTTTVKTTWNEPAIDPVTETYRSSTHSHSVVNGHAHAQAFSYVTPQSINNDDGQDIHVADEENEDEFVDTQSHRRSLHEYKH